MSPTALLALEDGTVFYGRSIGARGRSTGEVVFNTAMTGYQEILSDPSYAEQIVTLTYPHIGNTGANGEDIEAQRLFARGLVIRDLPALASSWRMQESLPEFLQRSQMVAVADIDTRRLTRLLREKGAQRGCIMADDGVTDERVAIDAARSFPGLAGMDLARVVTTDKPYRWDYGAWSLNGGYTRGPAAAYHIAAYDFGIKHNILRLLVDRGCDVSVFPATTPAEHILEKDFDGVFLSNGPGDPQPCIYAIQAIARLIEAQIPIFGICLGHQLLALASGAVTEKMKCGHHGANHPVSDLASGRVMITSQNHGFAVSDRNIPDNLKVTHRSLFDGSIQGIARLDAPAFSFQGHPEASPGPHDVIGLFDDFISLINHRPASGSTNA